MELSEFCLPCKLSSATALSESIVNLFVHSRFVFKLRVLDCLFTNSICINIDPFDNDIVIGHTIFVIFNRIRSDTL